jgi:uncharacterized protein (TIGR00369 family)
MTPGEELANPAGLTQGGFLAALADSAMAASVITNLRGTKAHATSADLQIRFLRPAPTGEPLTCTARVIGGGRRAAFVEAELADSEGRVVAKATSTYLLTARD